MAQKAVEDYLTNVSENTLLKEQDSVDIRGLRQDLLKSALDILRANSPPTEETTPGSASNWPRPTFASARSRREIGSQRRRSTPSARPWASGAAGQG